MLADLRATRSGSFLRRRLWDIIRFSGLGLVVVVFGAALFELTRHWRAAGPGGRRALWPMVVAAPFFCVFAFAGYFADALLDEAAQDATHSINVLGILQGLLIPVAIVLGAIQARLARGNVAELAMELGRGVPVGGLQPVLARALRDPSLRIAFPAPSGEGLVDPEGRPASAPGPGRATTALERDGELLALLIHDPVIELEDPGLVEAVGTVATMALENERLAAQVRAQLEEVRASRERIVEAADAERRRVERDLHDGAQQRLVALAMRLDLARQTTGASAALLDEATTELRAAVAEVRDLARGLHPTILVEAGLGPAIEALAERTQRARLGRGAGPPLPGECRGRCLLRGRGGAHERGALCRCDARTRRDPGGGGHAQGGGPGRRPGRGRSGAGIRPAGPHGPGGRAGRPARDREPARWRHDRPSRPPAPRMTEAAAPIRVALADDAELLRDALAASLSAVGFEVVGGAADVPGLLELVDPDRSRCRDRRCPDAADAYDRGTRRCRRESAPQRPRDGRDRALRRGPGRGPARRLLDEGTRRSGLPAEGQGRQRRRTPTAAIRSVASGGSAIDPAVVARLLGRPRRIRRSMS